MSHLEAQVLAAGGDDEDGAPVDTETDDEAEEAKVAAPVAEEGDADGDGEEKAGDEGGEGDDEVRHHLCGAVDSDCKARRRLWVKTPVLARCGLVRAMLPVVI